MSIEYVGVVNLRGELKYMIAAAALNTSKQQLVR